MLAAERGAAINTLLAYRRDLEGAEEAIGDLVKADAAAFASLGAAWAGLAPSSLARKCSALRQFCGFMRDEAWRVLRECRQDGQERPWRAQFGALPPQHTDHPHLLQGRERIEPAARRQNKIMRTT